jgi:hypothetical protein
MSLVSFVLIMRIQVHIALAVQNELTVLKRKFVFLSPCLMIVAHCLSSLMTSEPFPSDS